LELDLNTIFSDLSNSVQYRYMFFSVSVGAGSAGSVLASRLSDNSHVTVLLIEAGGDDRNQPSMDVPMYAVSTQEGSIDWQYMTEPQKEALYGFTDRVSGAALRITRVT